MIKNSAQIGFKNGRVDGDVGHEIRVQTAFAVFGNVLGDGQIFGDQG